MVIDHKDFVPPKHIKAEIYEYVENGKGISKMRSEEELNEIAIEVLSKVLDDNKRLGIQMIKHMNSNSTPDEVMSTISELSRVS